MKLVNPFRSKFISSNATLGLPTLVRLFVGVAKSKTAALFLGTAGVGVVGVGNQLQSLGVTFASVGSSASFTRELSRCVAQGDREFKRDLLGTSFTLQLIINLPLVGLGMLLIKPLARVIFSGDGHEALLLPILLTIPQQAFMMSHIWGVFSAHGRLDLLARASIAAAVTEACAYILLVRHVGVVGAFWGVTCGMTAWMLILTAMATRLERPSDLFHLRLRKDLVRELLGNGAMMSIAGLSTYFASTVIRIRINEGLGSSAAGIFQAVMALTAYYVPYLTNGVWNRLFPKLSASGLSEDSLYEWSEAIILTAILAAAVEVTLMALAAPLISLVYSKAFLAASPLATLEFVGDLVYLVCIPCLGAMMGLNYMKTYLVVWTTYQLSYFGLATLLMSRLGLLGAVYGYWIANAGMATACLLFFARKARGSGRLRATFAAIGLSLAAVTLQASLCRGGAAMPVRLAGPALWAAFTGAVLLTARGKSWFKLHAHEAAA